MSASILRSPYRSAILFAAMSAALLAACQGYYPEAQPGAGGRRVRMDRQEAGPYLLRAVTSPDPPLVGQMFVEVRVADGATGEVLTDVDVRLLAEPADGPSLPGGPLRGVASQELAPTPREYAASVPIPETGFWKITIQVEGHHGAAEASFLERVSAPGHWIHVLVVAVPFLGLIGLGYGYSRLRPRPEAPAAGS
jgi:hypothetical protein